MDNAASEEPKTKSFFSSKINAAPFVPTASTLANQTPEAPRKTSGLTSDVIHASPFVPSSGAKQATASPQQQSSPASGSSPAVNRVAASNKTPASAARGARSTPPRGDGRFVNDGFDDSTAASQQGPNAHSRGGYGGRASPAKPSRGGGSMSASREGSPSPYQGRGRGFGRGGDYGSGMRGGPRGVGARGTYAVASGSSMGMGSMGMGMVGIGSAGSGASSIPAVRLHEQFLMGPGRASVQSRFLGETLRQQMQHRSYLVQAQWTSEIGEVDMPDKIQHYHTLYPLEDINKESDQASAALGLHTCVLKGISAQDGQPYALRRIDGKQVIPTADLLSQARQAVDTWAPLSNHPHLVGLRSAFVSNELDGSNALFFVHDYHPGSLNMAQAHLMPTTLATGMVTIHTPSEDTLWSYLLQLASTLRSVHTAGLRLRPGCLHPSKVLLCGLGRLRVSSIGILDALSGDMGEREDLARLQRQDLSAVGQLLLALACAGISPVPNLDVCAAHFSMELTRIVAALCASADGGQLGSWRQLVGALADRSMAEMDGINVIQDSMVSELSKEYENGRLLRLLIKLGFINERPDADGDTQWAETGDRYLLKLFRDFVFHQYTVDGGPQMDWGYIIEALNKLDAGVPEKVLLLSRDEQSLLLASYGDIKRCVERAYAEIKAQAHAAKAKARAERMQHGDYGGA